MRIFIDADACPVKQDAIELARAHAVAVVLVASRAHEMPADERGVEVIVTDIAPQATDMAIINRMGDNDLVITDDYGLACLALGKRGRALSSRGQEFTDANIDYLMDARHVSARARRAGHHLAGPRAFTAADRAHFRRELARILNDVMSAGPPSEF